MARAESNTSKLLDCWIPPANAGDPIGCITTSFTFDSEFFEEECLSRFLQMDTDPREDGPLYLIEREEKLAQVEPISVIVDEAHCRGKRSLRWDLIGFRNTHLLHSKITILIWAGHIRIIIASANLTPSGYRSNKEIFGVFDFSEKDGVDLKNLDRCMNFFRELTIEMNQDNPAVIRLSLFINRIPEISKNWGKQKLNKGIECKILMTGNGYSHLLQQINVEVRKKKAEVNGAYVISPFYVDPADKNPAIKLLTKILKPENNPKLCWYGRVEEENEGDKQLFYGPPSLKDEAKSLGIDRVSFYGIKEREVDEKNKTIFRHLHMKAIWLESDDYLFYCIGSSNFTTNGLGISRRPNFEANILYIIDNNLQKRAYSDIKGSFPDSYYLGKNVAFCEASDNTDERLDEKEISLPSFFSTAIFDKHEERHVLNLEFDTSKQIEQSWKILDEDKNILLSSNEWIIANEKKQYSIEWQENYIPSDLIIYLENGTECRWPVIAKDASILPAPEDLGDLDLEVLIQLLATNRPLHHAMRKWLKETDRGTELEVKEFINPHDKVDVSSFLLRRTRKISYAFTMLMHQLERPFYTKATLNWRFKGPVGVMALAKAILREAKSEEEKIFLIAELSLELSVVSISVNDGCIPKKLVAAEIRNAIKKLREKSKSIKNRNSMIKEYSESAFKKSLENV